MIGDVHLLVAQARQEADNPLFKVRQLFGRVFMIAKNMSRRTSPYMFALEESRVLGADHEATAEGSHSVHNLKTFEGFWFWLKCRNSCYECAIFRLWS
jgi:hypothetical protein